MSTTPTDSSTDLGRETRAYVSGYNRSIWHESTLCQQERRQLVAAFNGAMPVGAKTVKAVWRIESPCAIAMAGAAIDASQRSARVAIVAAQVGIDWVRCQVTMDNGGVLNQIFRVGVVGGPYFEDNEPQPGPQMLVALA
jgi:hypothetical protein